MSTSEKPIQGAGVVSELPADLIADLRTYIESMASESGYGYARPANPHDFHPDAECCTEEEIAAHKAACEAYDKGEYTPERGSEWVGKTHILRAPWGIGGYTFRDATADALLARLAALASAPVAPAQPVAAIPDSRAAEMAGDLSLKAAMDAAYPVPDTPHGSVLCRAYEDRAAFTRGWNARPAQQVPGLTDAYNELIYAVERKSPGESRHQTALRYIRAAEVATMSSASAAEGEQT